MTFRSRSFLDLARGQDCTVLSPVCNRNPETTVTAHNPFGDRGTGIKCPDWDSCWSCSDCHDVLDGRRNIPGSNHLYRTELFALAKRRTQERMWEQGLIEVAGHASREPKPKKLAKVLERDAWKERAA